MKRFSDRHLPRVVCGVNPLPLVDAAAVLLLVFLVLFLLPAGRSSPDSSGAQEKNAEPAVMARLSINRDLEFTLDDMPVPASELESTLRARTLAQPGLGVVVHTPGSLASRSLSMIMETLHRAGVAQVALDFPDAEPAP